MSKLSSNVVSHSFIIALFNIYHLAIVGVTITSKFFSDVFYIILHYAKVGGLPLAEFNQLKLQFLLSDFCLIISSTEMPTKPPPTSTATYNYAHAHVLNLLPLLLLHPPLPAPSKTETETETEMEMETEATEMTNDKLTI
ncbi:hypothetical protein H0H87_006270 [Tephrocybe sp. NHM501043]|nr:hypothetical protein H0H87_006270 [Tephrocybe sp. NHM501043]